MKELYVMPVCSICESSQTPSVLHNVGRDYVVPKAEQNAIINWNEIMRAQVIYISMGLCVPYKMHWLVDAKLQIIANLGRA